MLAGSKILIDVALGLILYKLGNLLHPNEFLRFRRLTLTALAESSLSFLAVALVMMFFGYNPVFAALVGAIAKRDGPETLSLSLLLVSMAGMAIGMTATLNDLVPAMGEKVAAIVFVMIAIFETIGPFAAVKAFHLAGEVDKSKEYQD